MSALVQNRTPKSTTRERRSVFFQDLATPISSSGAGTSRAKFSTPGQAAAVSSLWRENFGGGGGSSDLPPPPMFTLDDRADFSPESPKYPSPSPFPAHLDSSRKEVATPISSSPKASASPSAPGERGKGSPVEGVVHPSGGSGLLTLPPPREVARPEIALNRNNAFPSGNLPEEEWVTVYGFSPGDTNLVLREFEKCGVILKHIPGPREANWMHILYQSRSDAQKALNKSGMQINGVLIVGVKPVDPVQQQALNERLSNQGFMPLPLPASTRTSETNPSRALSHSYHLQNGSASARQPGGAIASPAKSVVSKFFDVMFGI